MQRALSPARCRSISRCRTTAWPPSAFLLPRPAGVSSPFSTHIQPPLRKKITTLDIARLHASGTPITMVTAYTYPSSVHVDAAGIDVLLVGDSLGMVELGYETTLPVSMEEMLHHARAVSRGANSPLLVADLPFGSYEASASQAHGNAVRFLKEAGMDAVKLEGGRQRAATVRHLVDAGIAVMGHIGLTPQQISTLGGFRAQGKTRRAASLLMLDALALQQAGAFAIVIECTPPALPAAAAAAPQRAAHRHRQRAALRGSGARLPRPARLLPARAPRQGRAQLLQAVRGGRAGDTARTGAVREGGAGRQLPRR